MKRSKLRYMLSITIFVIIFIFSCEKAFDSDNNLSKKMQTGEIEAKAYPEANKKISFWANAQKLTIDWGDGTVDDFAPNGVLQEFTHSYTNRNLQTLKITTDALTALASYSEQGMAQELRLGNCPDLQLISYSNQLLTVFELAETNSLLWIDCHNNRLSSFALNSLFRKLPTITDGYIDYKGNSGAEDCDFDIAAVKGWKEDIQFDPSVGLSTLSSFFCEENMKMLLSAASKATSDFIRTFYLFESLYSNTIEEGSLANFHSYQSVYQHEINSYNNLIANMWRNSYRAMQHHNLIIQRISESNQPECAKYIYMATMLRAYIYFVLINCWGDVPFLNETNFDGMEYMPSIKRESQSTILSELVANLLSIEQNLPESERYKYFAQLLLSKIYTYQKDYANALQYAHRIINSNYFTLSADCLDIFGNDHNSELIPLFTATYESGNNQYEMSLIKKGKYMPIARYCEALLLAAENSLRLNKSQEAIAWVNELKMRNGRPLLASNATETQITAAILEEYKWDLGKEGLYFFALKRFNVAESMLNIASYQLYLPIPYIEIVVNPNIIQNQEY